MPERYRVKKRSHVVSNQLKNSKIKSISKKTYGSLRRINYKHTFTVLLLPGLCAVYLFRNSRLIPENPKTIWFSIFYFNFTILAFSSGYHKYFSHNAFVCNSKLLLYYFGWFGSSLGLGSINWWSTLHKSHHQYTDNTERDPYLIKRGLYHSHLGWLIKAPKMEMLLYDTFNNEVLPDIVTDKPDVNDSIQKSRKIKDEDYFRQFKAWQHQHYMVLFILTTLVIPGIINKFYCKDTFLNGMIYPGIVRMFVAQHCLLTAESICHFAEMKVTIPTQPFNDSNSSVNCNNPFISIITYGQSKQNFHHEFPHDYRNDSSWISFDPTKWFLYCLNLLGIITDLSITPRDLITQLRIQQLQKVLNRLRSRLNWGTPISKLPLITPGEFKRLVATAAHKNRIYIVISNVIHDITPFMDQHPGGLPLLQASHAKDATNAFYGGVYSHLTAAQNLLATMRIGYLDVGNQEEIWRKIVKEEGEVNEEHKQYNSAEAA